MATLSEMLPTAGLFLPETLHRGEGSDRQHTEATRLRFFPRSSGRSKQELKDPANITPSNAERVSYEDAASSYPSITIAFEYAAFVSTTNKATTDSAALANLILRVRQDLTEASRLYLSPAVKNFLEAWPDKRTWIDTIFHDVRRTLNDIGTYIETLPVVGDVGGQPGLRRRFEWVLGHQKKVANKQHLLATCHQSLMSSVTMMSTIELCGVTNGMLQDPIFEAPVQPWVKRESSHLMRGPYSRRETRLSQKNLTSPNVNLEQSEMDSTDAGSVESLPIELPGSTPEDWADPDNMDLYILSGEREAPRQASNRRYSDEIGDEIHINRGMASQRSPSSSGPIQADRYLPYRPSVKLDTHRALSQHVISLSRSPGTQRTPVDSNQLYSVVEQNPESSIDAIPSGMPASTIDSLQTVHETAIERNYSTTSNTTVITLPRYARRHHPTSVYIQRYADRHQSLPTVLPPFQSQPSLTEDLADWIVPKYNSVKLQSAEWDDSSTVSSSHMSVVSCPAVTEERLHDLSRPDQTDEEGFALSGVESEKAKLNHQMNVSISNLSPKRSAELFFNIPVHNTNSTRRSGSHKSCKSDGSSVPDKHRAASIRSITSSIARKPLPPSSVASLNLSVSALESSPVVMSASPITISTGDGLSPGGSEASAKANDSMSSGSSTTVGSNTDVASISTPLASPPLPDSDDAKLSKLQRKMLRQNYVSAHEENLSTEDEQVHFKTDKQESSDTTKQDSPEVPEQEQDLEEHSEQTHEQKSDEQEEEDMQVLQRSTSKLSRKSSCKSWVGGGSIQRAVDSTPDPEKDSMTDVESNRTPPAVLVTEKSSISADSAAIVVEDAVSSAPPPPAVAPKPMTAGAKRRAAQQRRMQLAFGGT